MRILPALLLLLACAATVRADAPGKPSSEDRANLRRYMVRNFQRIEYCYAKEQLKQPKLAGTVTIRFVIEANGKPTSVEATGLDPNVAGCIVDVVKGITFMPPTSHKPIAVEIPRTFAPPQQ
jgi:hypothetical protein